MPVVPRLDPSIRPQGLPNIKAAPDAPASALGVDEKVGASQARLGGMASEFFAKEKEKADDAVVLDRQEKLVNARNDLQWNEKTGAYSRRGQDALGITEEYMGHYAKIQEDLSKGLTNDQRAKYDQIAVSNKMQLHGALEQHTFAQMQKFGDDTAIAAEDANLNDTVKNFMVPGKISAGLAEAERLSRLRSERLGADGEIAEGSVKAKISQIHAGIVERQLTMGLTKDAEKYFNENKGAMNADDLDKADKLVQSKMEFENNVETYNKVKGFRLSDGAPNLKKVDDYIDKLQVPTEKKEAMKKYAESQMADDFRNYKMRIAGQDYDFSNKVLQAKKDGTSLQTVKDTLSTKLGFDPVRKRELDELATKLYKNDVTSDPVVLQRVRENIMENRGNPAIEISDEERKGNLSAEHANDMRRLIWDQKHRNDAESQKGTMADLAELADEKFGRGKKAKIAKAAFLNEVRDASQGKGYQETYKIGKDLLESKPTQNSTWNDWVGTDSWFTKTTPAYQQRAQESAERNAAAGYLYQTYGKTVTEALGGPEQYEEGLKRLGLSAEQVKVGTPMNKAIEILVSRGIKPTKKRLEMYLKEYPSGEYTPSGKR
jgi:hypothetical protein